MIVRLSVSILAVSLVMTSCNQAKLQNDSSTDRVQGEILSQQNRGGGVGSFTNPSPGSPIYSWDDQLADIARTYPAFGGYYVNDTQDIVILVAKYSKGQLLPESERGRRVGQIRKALLEALSSDSAPQTFVNGSKADYNRLRIINIDGKNSFADVQDWRPGLRSFMLNGIVSSLGINDKSGKIQISVPDEDSVQKAEDALTKLGVDRDSVESVRVERNVQQLLITDTIRPPAGGIQIGWIDTSLPTTVNRNRVCTIGVNASLNGQNGFLTASHCSPTQGGYDGNVFTNKAGLYNIGTEAQDTAFSSQTFCNSNADANLQNIRCQLADALFATYSVASNRGKLVRTNQNNTYIDSNGSHQYGSKTIVTDASNNATYIDVTAVARRAATGTLVGKIGATSGYSSGIVTQDNQDNLIATKTGNMVLINAQRIESQFNNIATCGGDSGGPWFVNTSTGATLVGLISAGGDRIIGPDGTNVGCDNYSIISPMDSIYKVFGGETSLLVTRP